MNAAIAIEVNERCDVQAVMQTMKAVTADAVVLPLLSSCDDGTQERLGVFCSRFGGHMQQNSDIELGNWVPHTIGKVSEGILSNQRGASLHEPLIALEKELSWAAHISLQSVILPIPSTKESCVSFARDILSACSGYQQVLLQIPLFIGGSHDDDLVLGRKRAIGESIFNIDDIIEASKVATSNQSKQQQQQHPQLKEIDGWELFDCIRQYVGDFNYLGVVIDITDANDYITQQFVHVPLLDADAYSSDALTVTMRLQRWAGEPVKAIRISTMDFCTNHAGYPVLRKEIQRVIFFFLEFNCQLILHVEGSSNQIDSNDLLPYVQYLRHLRARFASLKKESSNSFIDSYKDILQAPLQPLMDNLSSQTYEVFEKDPMKYQQYRRAIVKALIDKKLNYTATAAAIVVTVVGAGRGPLINAVLCAAKEADVKIRIYAVEKNENAVATLHSRMRREQFHKNAVSEDEELRWTGRVIIIDEDMRNWKPPELCDIMVSELLGSFGDNELSPECLYGIQHCLKANGINIPQDYTSYLAPISSAKLWCAARRMETTGSFELMSGCSHNNGIGITGPGIRSSSLEVPYVVNLHSYTKLANEQPFFKFIHPHTSSEAIDNRRYQSATFTVPDACSSLLHGFAGYFHSTLYKDVHLSIVPQSHTPNMFSWFPIYFPLLLPVRLRAAEKVTIHMWRSADRHGVWYEWCLSEPSASTIHNANGRSYKIGT